MIGFDKEKNVAIEHVDTIETSDGRVVMVLERQRPQRLVCYPERITTVHSDLCV